MEKKKYIISPQQVHSFFNGLTLGESIALGYSEIKGGSFMRPLSLRCGEMIFYPEHKDSFDGAAEKFASFAKSLGIIAEGETSVVKDKKGFSFPSQSARTNAAITSLHELVVNDVKAFVWFAYAKKVQEFCEKGYEHFPGRRHEGPDNFAIFNKALQGAEVSKDYRSYGNRVQVHGNSERVIEHNKYWDFLHPPFQVIADMATPEEQRKNTHVSTHTAVGLIAEIKVSYDMNIANKALNIVNAVLYNSRLVANKEIDLLEGKGFDKPNFFVTCVDIVKWGKETCESHLGIEKF